MPTKDTSVQSAANPEPTKPPTPECGPSCCCGNGGAGPGRRRWLLGGAILAVAAGLAARAVLKGPAGASCASAAPAGSFTAAATAAVPAAVGPDASVRAVATPPPTAAAAATAPTASPAGGSEAPLAATFVGTEVAGLAELNTLALDTSAVLLFVPGKGPDPALPPTAPMEAAARTISAQGKRVGLFTLKPGTADYAAVAGQTATPAVLALVRGRGMAAVPGEVTETKLVQAYLAALNAGGGCCGGGPTASSCK